jgi:hypothetical protein
VKDETGKASVLSFIRDYSFILLPALLALATLNLRWYYLWYFDFDVIPYLNVSDAILMAFYSLGDFSVAFFLVCSSLLIGTIYYYFFVEIAIEKLGQLLIDDIVVRNSDMYIQMLESSVREGRNKRIKKVREIRDQILSAYDENSELYEQKRRELDKDIEDLLRETSEAELATDKELDNYRTAVSNHKSKKTKLLDGDFSDLLPEERSNLVRVPIKVFIPAAFLIISNPLIMFVYALVIEHNGQLIYSSPEFLTIAALVDLPIILILWRTLGEGKLKLNLNMLTFWSIFSLLYTNQVSNTLREGILVKHNLKYYGTEVSVEESKYASTKSVSYIGRTKDYLFFYDFEKQTTSVIASSDVKTQKYKLRR